MDDADYLIQIRNAVSYDPLTGVFKRRVSAGNVLAGSVVGNPDKKGYLKAMVCGRYHKLHRLAWFYTYGTWPKEIDHKNQVKSDNWLDNLRDVSTSINCTNQTGPRRNNKTGFQGVYEHTPGVFRAKFRSKCLGLFSTPEAAHAAYMTAKRPHLPKEHQ